MLPTSDEYNNIPCVLFYLLVFSHVRMVDTMRMYGHEFIDNLFYEVDAVRSTVYEGVIPAAFVTFSTLSFYVRIVSN